MSDLPRDQKDEKDEKDEKQHEKEEKGRSDPLSTIVWGAIIIWAGVVLLAENLGWLAAFGLRGDAPLGPFPFRISTWGLIFLGAGIIIFAEVAARLILPSYRRHVAGSIILGFVFVGIGLGNLVNWGVIWALVLIALGVVILLRAMGWKI
ncbi:MAG: hypothetical protein AB1817_13170 [Chloroflexota bacterium]